MAPLPCTSGPFHTAAALRFYWPHGARVVQLPVARHGDHRDRFAHAWVRPALFVARGAECRRLDRCATLLQAAGAVDLVGSRRDGAWGRAVAFRPAPARWGAEAGTQQSEIGRAHV